MEHEQPTTWRDWYRFAEETLGYERVRATQFATRRVAEARARREQRAEAKGAQACGAGSRS